LWGFATPGGIGRPTGAWFVWGKDIHDLQALVRASHDRTFRHTELRERLRDLAQQVAELSHHRDDDHLATKAGDVAWALLQLLSERGLALDDVVTRCVRRLDDRRDGRHRRRDRWRG